MFRMTLLALLAACGTSTPESAPPEPATPEVAPPPPPAASPKPSELVPSPLEIQQVLQAGGIETKLGTLIPERAIDVNAAEQDRAAVRTGVVLADMLLTVKTSSKETLVGQIDALQKGMKQLEGGADIEATLTEVSERVKIDAVGRDELLKEFDELSHVMTDELTFNGVERIVPLIQAGSWLEATHLVAKALKGSEPKGPADALLKQPEVVSYFQKYTTKRGEEEGIEMVTQRLASSLSTLEELAKKSEPLSDEDLDAVINATSEMMSQL